MRRPAGVGTRSRSSGPARPQTSTSWPRSAIPLANVTTRRSAPPMPMLVVASQTIIGGHRALARRRPACAARAGQGRRRRLRGGERPRPGARAETGSTSASAMAWANARGSAGGTSRAVPAPASSGTPPTAVATTGTPLAIASSMAIGWFSACEGTTSRASCPSTSPAGRNPRKSTWRPRRPAWARSAVAVEPAPDTTIRGRRPCRATNAMAARNTSTPFTGSSTDSVPTASRGPSTARGHTGLGTTVRRADGTPSRSTSTAPTAVDGVTTRPRRARPPSTPR